MDDRAGALAEAHEAHYLPETEDPDLVYQDWAQTLHHPELMAVLERAREKGEHFPVTLGLDLMEWAHAGMLPLEALGMTVHPDLVWRDEVFWAAHDYLLTWRDGNTPAT